MYTAYDFINNEINGKHMKFGWKVEIPKNRMRSTIILRYTMLNFKWESFDMLGEEGWELFLNSKSYGTMKRIMDKANERFKRTYFEEFSIDNLKTTVKTYGLKIDIDRLIDRTVKRKSDKIKCGIIKNI